MRFSILQWSSLLGLASLVVCAPLVERSNHYNAGELSQSPREKGHGEGKFGDYKNFKVQANDIVIVQFALMLEV